MRAMFAKTNAAIIKGSGSVPNAKKVNILGSRQNKGVSESISNTNKAISNVPKAPKTPGTHADASVLSVKNKPKQATNSSIDAAAKTKAPQQAAKATKPAKVKKAKHKDHSGALSKFGGMVKEAGHKAMEAAVVGSGLDPVSGGIKASLKGHKFGAPDGRHDDR